jgi:small GTP-binding protein
MAISIDFIFDVFLSHSSKDIPTVRAIAERLRNDGLNVWLDDWEIRPGDSIPAKIEYGLEHSRVLVLCMSINAFGSEWTQLEAGTFRFRDPLNQERRFIPLRLDETPVKGSLSQFLYLTWRTDDDTEYAKLLDACRPPTTRSPTADEDPPASSPERTIKLDQDARFYGYAFSEDSNTVLTGSAESEIRLWDMQTAACISKFSGHVGAVNSLQWSVDQEHFLSAGDDKTVRLWDCRSKRCIRTFEGHGNYVITVAWSPDQVRAISGSHDGTIRLWDLKAGTCLSVLDGHKGGVGSVAFSGNHYAISGGVDRTVKIWDLEAGRCVSVLEGHTKDVYIALSADTQYKLLSGGDDNTLRLWDPKTGRCLRIFEGHSRYIKTAIWIDEGHIASAGDDNSVRLWDIETARCVQVFRGHPACIRDLKLLVAKRHLLSGDRYGTICLWNLPANLTPKRDRKQLTLSPVSVPDQVQYTNAKVLLVGDTSAGKTGLAMRLALNQWRPTDSTVGAWATHWRLPISSADGIEREIWLWDFGGQADQRLIHQLYMEDTAVAVLVFDGQKEDVFETLGQWDRDLTRASRKAFTKLLVVGRVDAGALRVSRKQLNAFAEERGFSGYFETSAKADIGCSELRDAILAGIRWTEIPWRSSPRLFKRMKEEIIRLRDSGRVLMRFNELRDALHLSLAGEDSQFNDEELKAVVGLLAGPGVVSELSFGNWVLLQPERINAYAQAVIQTLRTDKNELGCIPEERVLSGNLAYESGMERLKGEDERFVLLAMHQTLIERGLCVREYTEKGPLLILPSYYRRERTQLVGHPAVLVSYQFSGFLDDIYATLVVRLHHTDPFQRDELWRYAADFRTLTGKQLGIKMTRRAEGAGELQVYFDPAIPVEEKIIFSRYVHEHLLQKAHDVVRLRHYVCEHCGTPVGNREVAMKRLGEWLQKGPSRPHKTFDWYKRPQTPSIICSECEKRVALWDELEQWFASPDMQDRVLDLQKQATIFLENETKSRTLVGEVVSTVAVAEQISREFNISDHGIDMEIEFTDDAGEPTGRKLYLQLKWRTSYVRLRRQNNLEVFEIKEKTDAYYWMRQAFPVLFVHRGLDGVVRWMDVRELLRGEQLNNESSAEVIFDGERFDVMSIRRWRDKVLGRVA